MAENLVYGALCQDRRPAAGDFERVAADSQKPQDARDPTIDARNQLPKVVTFVQPLPGLPASAGLERWQVAPHAG